MFVSVGFSNYVNSTEVIAVCRADSSPMKRLVAEAKNAQTAVDVTQGRKTKTILVMASGQLVLSALSPETIAQRLDGTAALRGSEEEEEECDEQR